LDIVAIFTESLNERIINHISSSTSCQYPASTIYNREAEKTIVSNN